MKGVPLTTVSVLLGHTSDSMTRRYTHLSPKHLTSAVRVLDPVSTSAHDNYMTIEPTATTSQVLARVRNAGAETTECLDGSWVGALVPKPGFEPGHPCGR
jgi:hypothetical protein